MSAPARANEPPQLTEDHSAFLSGPPRSGELSPFAQKRAAIAFIWLASIVVFGSTADFSSTPKVVCSPLCRFCIAVGVISFLFTTVVLVGHYFTWFSSANERRLAYFLAIWWTIGASALSAIDADPSFRAQRQHTSGLAIMFGWLAFFASIFGVYKSYHSQKEEQKSLRYAQLLSLQATEEEEYANFS